MSILCCGYSRKSIDRLGNLCHVINLGIKEAQISVGWFVMSDFHDAGLFLFLDKTKLPQSGFSKINFRPIGPIHLMDISASTVRSLSYVIV